MPHKLYELEPATDSSLILTGWITGHTYLSYGPLLCGASNVIYEGIPSYPSPARVWQIVEKYGVNDCLASKPKCPSWMNHDGR